MPDELTTENVTAETLKQLLEQAYYQVSVDEDNDVIVSGAYKSLVRIMSDNVIRIWASFRLVDDLAVEQILGAINTFNARTVIVKSFLNQRNQRGPSLVFETDMNYDGGLVPGNFVARLRAFEVIVMKAREFDEYTT